MFVVPGSPPIVSLIYLYQLPGGFSNSQLAHVASVDTYDTSLKRADDDDVKKKNSGLIKRAGMKKTARSER